MAPRKSLPFRLFLKRSLAFSPASNLASAFFLGSSDTSLVSALSVQPLAIFEYILPPPYIKKLSSRKGDPHLYRYTTKHHSFKAASLAIVSTISASCALKRVCSSLSATIVVEGEKMGSYALLVITRRKEILV